MSNKIGRNKEWCKAYKARGQQEKNKTRRRMKRERWYAKKAEKIENRIAKLLQDNMPIPSKWRWRVDENAMPETT